MSTITEQAIELTSLHAQLDQARENVQVQEQALTESIEQLNCCAAAEQRLRKLARDHPGYFLPPDPENPQALPRVKPVPPQSETDPQ